MLRTSARLIALFFASAIFAGCRSVFPSPKSPSHCRLYVTKIRHPPSKIAKAARPPTLQRRNRKLTQMGRLLVILGLCAGIAFAQQLTGTIKGQITDEFGGVIVGATVSAIDPNGVEKTATTNGDGVYAVNGLAPGKYAVRVKAKGFGDYEQADVELTAGRAQQLNVILKVTIEQ